MPEKRFSLVPIISTILKILAVLVVLFFLFQSIEGIVSAIASWRGGTGQFGQPYPPVTGFGQRLASLIGPIFNLVLGLLIGSFAWGFAELLSMIRTGLLGQTVTTPPVTKSEG